VGFAVKIFDLCDQLPKTAVENHIASQFLRSGSSSAPNYGEVRGAESTKDFVHKLGVVLK
jgi:four helix bundle protein